MLTATRGCRERNQAGEPCRQPPLREGELCFWHDPEHEHEAREARRLGGVRRRREGVLRGTYEFNGLATTTDLRRLLEIAALDALALDNSVARVRSLASIVQTGAKLLEVGELEERLVALEEAIGPRRQAKARA